MRTFLSIALLLTCLAELACSQDAPDARSRRPNVVVFVTDDQGYGDLGVHGNSRLRTPHLDRFAEQGVRVSRFYCSPVCAPTRASLLTGRYHYRTGVIHTSRGGAKMFGDEVTLAEHLKKAGYATGIFGKWHLGDNYPMRPQDQGFEETLVHKSGGIDQTPDKPNSYFDPQLWKNGERFSSKGYCTDVFVDAAIDFMSRRRKQPFFVYLAVNAPHTPLQVAERYSLPYEQQGLDEVIAKVYGMIENLDEAFGRMLAALDELGLREDTLVWFLGDNGPQQVRYNAGLIGRKGSVYEGGLRVPSLVQWPASIKGGRVVDSIAAHIDVLPTVLDAAGLPASERPIDGQSLAPILRGKSVKQVDRRLFFQCHRGLQPKLYQNAAVITQRFKLLYYALTFSDEKFQSPETPIPFLYDIVADPRESRNISQAKPRIVADLAKSYQAWFEDVRKERNFEPGVIVISDEVAGDTHLCRYQDATFKKGEPTGWKVKIVHGGMYRIAIRHKSLPRTDPKLEVRWQVDGVKTTRRMSISEKQPYVEVKLDKGVGELQVQLVHRALGPVVVKDNSTNGDVVLTRLDDAK